MKMVVRCSVLVMGPGGLDWQVSDQQVVEDGDNPLFVGGIFSGAAAATADRLRAQVDTRFGVQP